jgi:hypothetical protein
MTKFLHLTLWNANGPTTAYGRTKNVFNSIQDIDVMLISEMHFYEKSYLKIPKHTVYHTNHPAGTA